MKSAVGLIHISYFVSVQVHWVAHCYWCNHSAEPRTLNGLLQLSHCHQMYFPIHEDVGSDNLCMLWAGWHAAKRSYRGVRSSSIIVPKNCTIFFEDKSRASKILNIKQAHLLLLLWVGLAEIPPIALQPSRPFVLLPLVFGSSVHPQRRPMPDGMRDLCERKEEVWARNGRWNLARQSDFHVITGFFNMPQSRDARQAALLSLRRKACCGFFRPKNPMASAVIESAILGTRGQHANH
jgi:hypothetical protein